jgi:hypothetical protein
MSYTENIPTTQAPTSGTNFRKHSGTNIREPPGSIQGAFREHSGSIQGAFGEHSGTNLGEYSGRIEGGFREHSGNIQGRISGNIQGAFRERLPNIKGAFRYHTGTSREYSGSIQGTFREHSGTNLREHPRSIQRAFRRINGAFREHSGSMKGRSSGNIKGRASGNTKRAFSWISGNIQGACRKDAEAVPCVNIPQTAPIQREPPRPTPASAAPVPLSDKWSKRNQNNIHSFIYLFLSVGESYPLLRRRFTTNCGPWRLCIFLTYSDGWCFPSLLGARPSL